MHKPLNTSEIVIIGAGLAGLFTALKLAPQRVTIISAKPLGEGAASCWAQGGIAASMGQGDTPESHAEDTIAAGAGLVDPKIALSIAREAPDRIEDLLKFGVPFDRNLEGALKLSREAAHSKKRIVRVKGDMAGRAIMNALINAVRAEPSIQIVENHEARKIITAGGHVTGLELANMTDCNAPEIFTIPASAIILAAGGIGQLYDLTTNPIPARGDAVAMAARAGAIIADAEFVQFHPTAINIGKDPAPLATEALRGEGAVLINGNDERFMRKIHDHAELAPRDIVARAVHREISQGRGAFLDCSKAIGRNFSDKFPTVFAICKTAGLDPTRDLIPVAPAAHYHMGGVLTDATGRTSLNGLWACGEAASSGLHGANRLASNSLLEAIVFAARIADDLNGTRFIKSKPAMGRSNNTATNCADNPETIKTIRRTMTKHVGVIRTGEGLEAALEVFADLDKMGAQSAKIKNMLYAAKLITIAALQRQESRGGHFRTDYPQTKYEFKKRSFLTNRDIEQHLDQRDNHRQSNSRAFGQPNRPNHLSLVKSS